MRQSEYNLMSSGDIIITNNDNEYEDVPVGQQPGKVLYVGTLGTPVMSDLQIQKHSFTDMDGNKCEVPEIRLDTVLITVTQTKNIVSTSIAGRSGTVKEYIAMGDYSVEIAAVINAPNGQYPTSLMADLIKAKTASVSLKVNSWYLLQYGITHLVITDFSAAQEAGKLSSQTVSISAISDSTFIIEEHA